MLALVLGGGAVAWVGFLWPAQYEKGVLALDERFREGPPKSPPTNGAPGGDLQSALALLGEQRAWFTATAEQIAGLRPAPPRYRQLQADLERVVQYFLGQMTEAERRARFMAAAQELRLLVQAPLRSTPGMTVGGFLAATGPALEQIRSKGDALFAEGGRPRPGRSSCKPRGPAHGSRWMPSSPRSAQRIRGGLSRARWLCSGRA